MGCEYDDVSILEKVSQLFKTSLPKVYRREDTEQRHIPLLISRSPTLKVKHCGEFNVDSGARLGLALRLQPEEVANNLFVKVLGSDVANEINIHIFEASNIAGFCDYS